MLSIIFIVLLCFLRRSINQVSFAARLRKFSGHYVTDLACTASQRHARDLESRLLLALAKWDQLCARDWLDSSFVSWRASGPSNCQTLQNGPEVCVEGIMQHGVLLSLGLVRDRKSWLICVQSKSPSFGSWGF
jgi:hypothetical protein